MNKSQLFNYIKSKGSIKSDRALKQMAERLVTDQIWNIVEENCFHAITNEPMFLFYNSLEDKYVDINNENVVNVNDGYLLESELLEELKYFTIDEIGRIINVTKTYETDRLLDCHSGITDSVADKIYRGVGILKDGKDDNTMTIGFELETNAAAGASRVQVGDCIKDMIDTRLGHAERDSTITGIEFISHIFTWNKLKKVKPLVQNMLLKMAANGLEATSGAGLHIHIGRNAFVNEEAFLRFYTIINAHNNRLFWQKLARRQANDYYVFADTPLEKNRLIKVIRKQKYSHGVAINQEHSATYEISIFASTLSMEVLYGSIELMVNLVKFCNNLQLKVFDKMCISNGEYAGEFLHNISNLSIKPLSLEFISGLEKEEY
ncbi:MAG: hypothetical protein ACOX1L_01740 [Erysipelotrichaceae bacterium]|jgi:hypothetical protein